MNIKAFFVDALDSALDLGIGTPDDVLRHVTPDVLATHLPRPLWARLLTACLGAPRVDAQLVVETIGIPNLCEHVPTSIIWACIAEIGARSLGKSIDDAQRIRGSSSCRSPRPRRARALRPVAAARRRRAADLDAAHRHAGRDRSEHPGPAGPTARRSHHRARARRSSDQLGAASALADGAALPPVQHQCADPARCRTARRPQAQVPSTLPTGTGRQPRTTTEVTEPEPETAVGSDWSQRRGEPPAAAKFPSTTRSSSTGSRTRERPSPAPTTSAISAVSSARSRTELAQHWMPVRPTASCHSARRHRRLRFVGRAVGGRPRGGPTQHSRKPPPRTTRSEAGCQVRTVVARIAGTAPRTSRASTPRRCRRGRRGPTCRRPAGDSLPTRFTAPSPAGSRSAAQSS